MPQDQIFVRLLVSALLESLVGLERERGHWAAGLRTHMLVCLGSCLFMITSAYGLADVLGRPDVVLEPSRIAAQVVTGVGFLGAGTILLRGEVVRGLTTAASLWAVAAVGLATGGGTFREAVVTTLFIVVILAALKPIEHRLFLNQRNRPLTLSVDSGILPLEAIGAAVRASAIDLVQMIVRRTDSAETDTVGLTVERATTSRILDLVEALRQAPGVREVHFSAPPPS